MKIGVVGAGNVGKSVAKLFIKHQFEVMIANSRDPSSLFSLGMRIPKAKLGTVRQVCEYSDIIFLAIPLINVTQLTADDFAGKLIVDLNNYYPARDGDIAGLSTYEISTAEFVANRLCKSTIVKAFNNILAEHIYQDARPKGSRDRRALPVASDDGEAKTTIMSLMDKLGFDPLDGGTLAESWRYERGKPAYCFSLNYSEMKDALAKAERHIELPLSAWDSLR